MKINPLPDSTAAAPAAAAGKTAAANRPAAGKTAAAPQAPATAVTVSSTARSSLEPAPGGAVDSEKVKAVREAIANGTYRVNAEAIADKMLASAQEMLDSSRRR